MYLKKIEKKIFEKKILKKKNVGNKVGGSDNPAFRMTGGRISSSVLYCTERPGEAHVSFFGGYAPPRVYHR